jgi:hypothetical protein
MGAVMRNYSYVYVVFGAVEVELPCTSEFEDEIRREEHRL